jgi:hypothetical protein
VSGCLSEILRRIKIRGRTNGNAPLHAAVVLSAKKSAWPAT